MREFRNLVHDMFTPLDYGADGTNEPEWMKNVGRRYAPTQWDLVKDRPECFGPTFDFHVIGSALYADSEAAKAWMFSKLPEELVRPYDIRSDTFGFDVGQTWVTFIVHRASQDNLISEDEYRQAEEENHRMQW